MIFSTTKLQIIDFKNKFLQPNYVHTTYIFSRKLDL